MQTVIEGLRAKTIERFNSLFVKEMLIKLVAGLVKEKQETYFSDEVLDYKRIESSQVFVHLVNFLKDMLRLLTQELGLDDEKKVYLGLIIFKERLSMYMLGRTLETLRDILLLMPSKSESLKHYQTYFKEYIDKIVVERKFTARFVGNSG